MTIQGVLLDVDGTLVLSNDAHARAWRDAFAEQGYDVSYDRLRSLMGMGGDKLLPEVVPGLSDSEGAGSAITRRRKEIFLTKYVAIVRPAPDALRLVEHMREVKLKIIVASSAQPDELQVLLEIADLAGLLPERTTAQDSQESKPAPDIVAVALQRIGLPAGDVLMMGDTPYDISSARKVDVGTVALRCGGFSDDQLTGAVAIYDDPAELLRRYAASPLGPRL